MQKGRTLYESALPSLSHIIWDSISTEVLHLTLLLSRGFRNLPAKDDFIYYYNRITPDSQGRSKRSLSAFDNRYVVVSRLRLLAE